MLVSTNAKLGVASAWFMVNHLSYLNSSIAKAPIGLLSLLCHNHPDKKRCKEYDAT